MVLFSTDVIYLVMTRSISAYIPNLVHVYIYVCI